MTAAVASRRRPPVRRVNMRNGSARRNQAGWRLKSITGYISRRGAASPRLATALSASVRIDGRRAPGGDIAGGKRCDHQHTRRSGERGSIDRRDAKQQRRHPSRERIWKTGRPTITSATACRVSRTNPSVPVLSPRITKSTERRKSVPRRSPGSVHHELLETVRERLAELEDRLRALPSQREI